MEIINRKQYVDRVLNYLGKGLILVLTGQRRVGKSCVLQSVAKQITAKDDSANVIYINKEYAEFNSLKTDEDLNEYVSARLKEQMHNYLFVDEVQDIDGFENALRNFQAKDLCDIVVTGSNAKMLSGELATYLSGRYVEIHIQSLSYSEFLLFHRLPDTDDTFLKYLTWGGLPQLAHIGLDNRQMLTDYLGEHRPRQDRAAEGLRRGTVCRGDGPQQVRQAHLHPRLRVWPCRHQRRAQHRRGPHP